MPRRRRPGPPPARPAGSVRAAALRLLGRRDYTTAELTAKLIDRGYSHDEVSRALGQLAGDGLVDDRRAAAAHVRTASRVKGRGRLRIARELEARGLAPPVIADALSALTPDDETREIERLLERRRLPGRPDAAQRRRIFQHLLRRGFSAELIAAVLRQRGD